MADAKPGLARRAARYGGRRSVALCASTALATVVGLVGVPIPSASAGSSPGPSFGPPNGPNLPCPSETFPTAGSARDAAPTPYEIPFEAKLGQTTPLGVQEGGFLSISNSLVTVTQGGPVQTDPTTGAQYGSIFAYACGVIQLPSEKGTIGGTYGSGSDPSYNDNFVFSPDQIQVSLGITGIPGVPLISAYGAVNGELDAQILTTPAANGGLNVNFDGGAKSTADYGPALASLAGALVPGSGVTLPAPLQSLLEQIPAGLTTQAGAACTLAIGNIVEQGVKDVAATGLTQAQATTPFTLTTQTSGHYTGRPVTGPITQANATLVANDFPVGAVVADTSPTVNSTEPAPGYPGHAYCSAQNAQLLNNLLGLPSIPDPATGHFPNVFVSPGTFSVYTSS